MLVKDNFSVNRPLAFKMSDNLRAFGSSAMQAFKDFANINTPGFNTVAHLGYSSGDVGNRKSPIQLSGGASSALRLPSGSFSSSGSGGYYVSSPSPSPSAQSLNYYSADLASRYGMDKSTAYQEALANTGYQRAVADMQQAGLNPASLFGAGKVSPAGGVYGASELPVVTAGSSGSAGSGRGLLFSKNAYGTIANVAGLVGLAKSKGNYGGYVAGQTAAKAVMSLANAFFR